MAAIPSAGAPKIKLPPPPPTGGHFVNVGGKPQLIHAIGPNQWRPGPPPPKTPAAKPPAPAFNPLTSTYGLNTTSKAAFDPLSPGATTVGGFNKQVLAAAQPQYLPQLQAIQGQQTAENTANKERTTDIGSLYQQYQQQAQQAFKQAQQALTGIVAQNNAGPGQANLQAALQSAQGGPNSLAQMMGINAPAGQSATLPYTGASQAAQTATQQELNSLASSYLTTPSQELAQVPLERATELNTESLRHQAATEGFQGQTAALVQQIPGIIEKAREQLVSDLQSAQSLKFQETLANKQFGLSAQSQAFNQAQTKKQFTETQLNDAANRTAQAATIAQNAAAQQAQIAQQAAAATDATAKAEGQARANAVAQITKDLTPTKDMMKTVSVPANSATGAAATKTLVLDPTKWHPDLGSILKSVMTLYGLDQNTALQLISAVGGGTRYGPSTQTIAQWADTFVQRSRPAAKLGVKVTSGIQSAGKSIAGSLFP